MAIPTNKELEGVRKKKLTDLLEDKNNLNEAFSALIENSVNVKAWEVTNCRYINLLDAKEDYVLFEANVFSHNGLATGGEGLFIHGYGSQIAYNIF